MTTTNIFDDVITSLVGLSPNLPSPGSVQQSNLFAAAAAGNTPNAHTLGALVSQHRLLELSRFGLRGYDLAQHMLSQQGAVSKLLGKYRLNMFHKNERFFKHMPRTKNLRTRMNRI